MNDPKINTLITENPDEADICIIGFPYDKGTEINNGRKGAKNGPNVFRKFLNTNGTVINPEINANLTNIKIFDHGNIDDSLSLSNAHSKLRKTVLYYLKKNIRVFVIGGTNDQSYPNVRALMDYCLLNDYTIDVINIDAHLDVRPLKNGLAHSGSPFFQMLNDEDFNKLSGLFVEYSCQGEQCSNEHAKFVKDKGHYIKWLSEVGLYDYDDFQKFLNKFKNNKMFFSFDIDSIKSSDCPGVSCPGIRGLNVMRVFEMCFLAGQKESIVLFDISEFNPKIEDFRTGKLVFYMFYYFLCGMSSIN
jgi:formiminoglutamase